MERFLDDLRGAFSCRAQEDGFVLETPIMYDGADHTFSFFIRKNAGGSFTVSDRGQTLSYLRENLSLDRYEQRLSAICERFEITRENDVLFAKLASCESNQTMRNLHKFLGAMAMVANIDLF